jgi:hypothetical protein
MTTFNDTANQEDVLRIYGKDSKNRDRSTRIHLQTGNEGEVDRSIQNHSKTPSDIAGELQ